MQGIFIDSDVTQITISNMEIDTVTGIGIQAQTMTNVSYISITNNFIHNTGTRFSDGNNGGQGISFGLFRCDHLLTLLCA